MSGPHFRIFVSSPDDVLDERAIAASVIENLSYDPALQEQMSVERVAWEYPDSAPLEANMLPQEAMAAGLPLPADCDIVVMIVYAKMGTPLIVDGIAYRSGTEFEYRNAMETSVYKGRPRILVFRREADELCVNINDPAIMEKYQQYQRVREFFKHEFDNQDTGRQRDTYQQYQSPDDFGHLLENTLKHTIQDILKRETKIEAQSEYPIEKPSFWEGSPFPGLRVFKPKDAPIFWGRGQEIDKLTARVRNSQFVAIVGASGCGKSSLVGAGLIPRLLKTSGQGEWQIVSFKPDTEGVANPFLSLASALPNDMGLDDDALATTLENQSTYFSEYINTILGESETKLLLFVDQFEELFTKIDPSLARDFIKMLLAAIDNVSLHLVMAVRDDFYSDCIAIPEFAELLERNTFPLAPPKLTALLEMIERPAERAGLKLEADLAQTIVEDTGDAAGSLALMAYLLKQLYQYRTEQGVLTFQAYENLGGVQGAIDRYFEHILAQLNDEQQATLSEIFHEIIHIRDDGTVTRKRADYSQIATDDNTKAVLKALMNVRLLRVRRGKDNQAYIKIAHDILLRYWTHLANWIELTKQDYNLLWQVRQAASEWHRNGRPDTLLWQHERLQPVYEMRERLNVRFSKRMEAFVTPEPHRLLDEFVAYRVDALQDASYYQMSIANRLAQIGSLAAPTMIIASDYALDESVAHAIKNGLKSFQPLYIDDVELTRLAEKVPPLADLKPIKQQRNYDLVQATQAQIVHLNGASENQAIVSQIYSATEQNEVKETVETKRISQATRVVHEVDVYKTIQEDIRRATRDDIQQIRLDQITNISDAHRYITIQENMRKAREENIRKAQEIIGGRDSLQRRIEEIRERTRIEVQEIRHQFERMIQFYTTGDYTKQRVLDKLMRKAQNQNIDEVVADLLNTLLNDDDYIMRYRAAHALSGKQEAMSILGLIQALKDEHKGVRKAVVEALGNTYNPLTLVFIVDSLDNDTSTSVQRMAASTLRKFYKAVKKQRV